MTSYGYIIVDLCIISLKLNCTMQLKQLYTIAWSPPQSLHASTQFDGNTITAFYAMLQTDKYIDKQTNQW